MQNRTDGQPEDDNKTIRLTRDERVVHEHLDYNVYRDFEQLIPSLKNDGYDIPSHRYLQDVIQSLYTKKLIEIKFEVYKNRVNWKRTSSGVDIVETTDGQPVGIDNLTDFEQTVFNNLNENFGQTLHELLNIVRIAGYPKSTIKDMFDVIASLEEKGLARIRREMRLYPVHGRHLG